MDQDSFFENGDFFNKAYKLIENKNLGIIAASYGGKIPFKLGVINDFHEILFTITSGNIVAVEAWEKCGKFEEKLFIDEVDHDFCLRLKIHFYKTVTSNDVFLKHKLGNSYSIKMPFSRTKREIGIHKPLRIFFMVRNGLYVAAKYFFVSPFFSLNRVNHLLIKFLLIISVYPNRRIYLRQYYLGIKKFITSDYTNRFN
jgi:rhamnosyltransferase